jgi:hypothetical protein
METTTLNGYTVTMHQDETGSAWFSCAKRGRQEFVISFWLGDFFRTDDAMFLQPMAHYASGISIARKRIPVSTDTLLTMMPVESWRWFANHAASCSDGIHPSGWMHKCYQRTAAAMNAIADAGGLTPLSVALIQDGMSIFSAVDADRLVAS